MSYRRDHRSSRAALLDDTVNLEEGALRASSSYSNGIDDHENEKTMDSLHDRVSFLKRLTGDIHKEVENHNHMLDRMGNEMDASRGIMSGTMDHFKMVLEKKSNRRICKLAAYFVVAFFVLYYIIRVLLYFMYGYSCISTPIRRDGCCSLEYFSSLEIIHFLLECKEESITRSYVF